MNPARFDVRDADFEARVRDSFGRQPMMRLLGAELGAVAPGQVTVVLPFRSDLTQQHGYVHAAAVTAIADNACGYAAMTLLAAGVEVLSVEFKINLLAPAAGDRLVAVGRVLRPGRTLTACAAEVRAERDGESTLVAAMQATMIASHLPGGPTADGQD